MGEPNMKMMNLASLIGQNIPVFFKQGVKFYGVKTETLAGIMIASFVYYRNGHALTVLKLVTENPGVERLRTAHDQGLAFDIRTQMIAKAKQPAMVMSLKDALGDDYDVVLEKDHIHIEFDTK